MKVPQTQGSGPEHRVQVLIDDAKLLGRAVALGAEVISTLPCLFVWRITMKYKGAYENDGTARG
jgi:hypothetical protein